MKNKTRKVLSKTTNERTRVSGVSNISDYVKKTVDLYFRQINIQLIKFMVGNKGQNSIIQEFTP